MIQTTNAIVINSLKYGDTSLITTCYTEKYGIKSYILKGILSSKKGKLKVAYFQPLSQISITAYHKNKGSLNTIKEVSIQHFYTSIYTDLKKQTIALFLAEVLYYAIKEEEKNETLYKYLETSLLWLDTHNYITNFHLLFLLNLTKFLGFYPKVNTQFEYFDLNEGKFTPYKTNYSVSTQDFNQFKKLLGINFDALEKVQFNAQQRQQVLQLLIQYFELHLTGFKKPKSLAVLKSVFST